MVARVTREKYYSGGDFFESSLGRRPSYAWRSIWNAKPLLQEGLVWKVGNGENIRIWKDRWLPPPNSTLVLTPSARMGPEARVAELIDTESKCMVESP